MRSSGESARLQAADTAASWTVLLKGGERLVVPATLKNFSTYVFLEFEDWFEPEVDFIRRLARPGFRALDVGANLGFYTIAIARRAGPTGHVWAFEPDPTVASRLTRSVAVNALANVTVHQLALGDSDGAAALQRTGSPEFNTVRAGAVDGERIEIARLDTVAPTGKLDGIDFVKLDAEGMETAILRGGDVFFRRESPLVMTEVIHAGVAETALPALFGELGYRQWRHSSALGRLIPLIGDTIEVSSINLFLCKADRAARLAADDLLVPAFGEPPAGARGAFLSFYRESPFGRRLMAETKIGDGRLTDPATEPYRAALDLYATSRNETLTPAVRAGCLQRSFDLLLALSRDRATVNMSRVLSLARVAFDLGAISQANIAADLFFNQMTKGGSINLPEPFLPLARKFETLPDRVPLGPWITAMTLESHSRRIYATSSGNEDCFRMIEHLHRIGLGTAETERRRQLFRIAGGAQPAPIVSELLAGDPQATINWDYWRGRWSEGAKAKTSG